MFDFKTLCRLPFNPFPIFDYHEATKKVASSYTEPFRLSKTDNRKNVVGSVYGETMSSKQELQKLISLTFDESPEVRKKAAISISKIDDDPGAMFALVELGYDKDPSVRDVANKILDKKKLVKSELMSFSEVFSYKPKEQKEETEAVFTETKRKIFYPIEQIFEKRLGKEKAEIVKKKMMPTLEKVYMRSRAEPQQKPEVMETERREALQQFLTTYLDAISDFNGPSRPPEQTHLEEEELEHVESADSIELLDNVSSTEGERKENIESIMQEVDSVREETPEELDNKFFNKAPDTLVKRAYEVMMYSGGDQKMMKKEMRRMLRSAVHDIKLAFKLAREKFQEYRIIKLSELREKMRNVTTDTLIVQTVEDVEFKKARSSTFAIRIVAEDSQGGEGVIYLFEGRGQGVRKGMSIKVEKGYVKVINGETALTISSRGNVYIVV